MPCKNRANRQLIKNIYSNYDAQYTGNFAGKSIVPLLNGGAFYVNRHGFNRHLRVI